MEREIHEVTGTRDATFDLVSVAYHALRAATACSKYEKDARDEGQPELAAFFRKVLADNRENADRAKELLRSRLAESAGRRAHDEAVDEASQESFPASDAPGY